MTLEELLRQGKSFGQGASNAAASTVTGPVDMLAWLLRKGGVNVGEAPIGGEAWMRQKGLMATPENRLAGLLGEGAGLAAPIVAAAKAPEIAGGLLQMGRNLATPQTMNKQTGAIVYHGSPHKFDKFDSSKIGTGEGAQAYGHGLYLAENPGVAEQYQKTLSNDGFLVGDKVFDPMKEIQHKNVKFWAGKGDLEGAIMTAEKIASSDSPVANLAKSDLVRLREIEKAGGISRNPGALYKVDLPDEHIAKMLDWDKPLSQQPHVLKALQDEGYSQKYIDLFQNHKGAELYKSMAGGEAVEDFRSAASDLLRKRGIPGIRYLDGGSRSAGAGSSNFVVFPGNEGLLKILERNGGKP